MSYMSFHYVVAVKFLSLKSGKIDLVFDISKGQRISSMATDDESSFIDHSRMMYRTDGSISYSHHIPVTA